MARDPLDTLLRLRRMAVQDRMRGLAASISMEDQACRTFAVHTETMKREIAEARSLMARDARLAGHAAWHPPAAQALTEAGARVVQAGEQTSAARVALGDARGAMRAVELELESRKAEADLGAERIAQHALDDATRRRELDGCEDH
jgi:hypothetical protein